MNQPYLIGSLFVVAIFLLIYSVLTRISVIQMNEQIKLMKEMNKNMVELDRLKDRRYSKLMMAQGRLLTCFELLKKEPEE